MWNVCTTGGALLCPLRADRQMLGKFRLVGMKNASSPGEGGYSQKIW